MEKETKSLIEAGCQEYQNIWEGPGERLRAPCPPQAFAKPSCILHVLKRLVLDN